MAARRPGGHGQPLVELDGYPDNLATGTDGLLWVTVGSPVEPVLELVHRAPARVRRLVSRLPAWSQPPRRRTVRVLAVDGGTASAPTSPARVVHDLDADAEHFHMVTGVREHHGRVWLGSLENAAVAYLDVAPHGRAQ